MKFQCSKCGACCKRAGQLGLMPQRSDGACIHLQEDNSCKIYNDRPDLCNVKKMYEARVKKGLQMAEKEYYKLNNSVCNLWIEQDGLPESYLIDTSVYDKEG